ncbi:cytochrome P450 9e2-like [Schistocerca cancellata]|uniref:cytochrome P450 9e2-like n=1 Tax=Schistocerca cancellata TaxID=274614 RepID=UPI002118BAC8|nr:cytochrome P450 9e2-like [Schistocerca cancellata]
MVPDWWTVCASAVAGLLVLAAFRWCRYHTHFARRGLPYAPPLPFVGNMLDTLIGRWSLTDHVIVLYNKFQKHRYAGVYFFGNPLVMVRDPEIVRTITIKDFDHFTDHLDMANVDKEDILLQKMLINLKGKEWHDMRTTLSPAFTTTKIKNMFVLMTETGQQMISYLSEKTAEHKGSSGNDVLTLEMKEFFTRVTNDVIATTAFGVRVDSLSEPNNTFYSMGRAMSNVKALVAFGYFVSPKLMKLLNIPLFDRRAEQYFRSVVADTIKTRDKERIVRPDVIQLLMQAIRGELKPEEDEQNGTSGGRRMRLTDEDVAAQAMLFFFAGFETVATVLTFCSYLLATNGGVQRRLQQEVDQLMGKSGGQPGYEQVVASQYLDMVVSETLRMYTPGAASDRKCVKPYRLPPTDSCPDGLQLEPGDGIWIPAHAFHHDAQYFPDPERFDPERFSPENKHLVKPFTYIPFGVGPRICIAQRFALLELKVMLVYLLSKFTLRVVEKTPVPLQIKPNSFMLSIKGGAWLGISPRS